MPTRQDDGLGKARVFRYPKKRASSKLVHFLNCRGLDVAGHGYRAVLCNGHAGTSARVRSPGSRNQRAWSDMFGAAWASGQNGGKTL